MQRWGNEDRTQRRHRIGRDDQRIPFQRDRDRVLYSSALRRLSGVSQIVRANEADVFHNRLIHTFKVAQIGRRTAEKFVDEQPKECKILGIHPEVVESACLIHDLGHPPFGHLGEKTLDELVIEHGNDGGFEGNAQSFRIVTSLSVRFEQELGLDLTKATLAASIKYPWLRDQSDPDKTNKWGAYRENAADFEFAREKCGYEGKTVEAAIMDWSDDIAYSVHDLEDLHRCRLIPWPEVATPIGKEAIVEHANKDWHNRPHDSKGRLRDAYDRIIEGIIRPLVPVLLTELYDGTPQHRQQLRFLTSRLIARYIHASTLKPDSKAGLLIDQGMEDEVRLLKQLSRSYLIFSPSLGAQQHGQRKIIKSLFEDFMNDEKMKIIPSRAHYMYELDDVDRPRATADFIASLTENEAIQIYRRLEGIDSGSVLDPIAR